MSDERRFIANAGISYPVGDSVERIKKAGGRSNMTPEELAELDIREVAKDQECTDIPDGTREAWLRRGIITEIREVLAGMTAKEAVAYLAEADQDELDAAEAEEAARTKPRASVLRAIESRREDLGGD